MADGTTLDARIGCTLPRHPAPPAPIAQPLHHAGLAPVWLPLALLLLALWPHWRWMAARMVDGSDEPWGAVALVTALVLVARERHALRAP